MKVEFLALLHLMKSTALLTRKHEGNEEAIVREMSSSVQRELNEEKNETIGYFVNDFSLTTK